MNRTRQLLICTDNVNLWGKDIYSESKTQTLLEARKYVFLA